VFRICREIQRSYWDPPDDGLRLLGPSHHGKRR
jgi:hypothetical protein